MTNNTEIAERFKELTNCAPEDPIWISIVNCLVNITPKLSVRELGLISHIIDTKFEQNHYYLASFMALLFHIGGNDDLVERCSKDEYLNDREMTELMETLKIYEDHHKLCKYAITLSGLYHMGEVGRSAAIICAIA